MTEAENRFAFKSLFAIIFVVSLGFAIIHPFFSVYVKEFGSSGFIIALMFSGYSLSKILLMPLLGQLSDSKSRSRFILSGLLIYVIVSACYLFVPFNSNLMVFLRVLQGAGAALVRPIALAFVGNMAQKKREGAIMGTFDVSFYAALVLGPIIGGLLNDHFGYRAMFGALLVLCSVGVVLAVLMGAGTGQGTSGTKRPETDYRKICENQKLQGLLLFIFARSFGIVVVAIFLPILMHCILSLTHLQIGVVVACGSILTPFLLRPFGKLSDRMDRRFLIILGGGLSGLLVICLPIAECFWQLLVMITGISVFSALSLPASSAFLVEEGSQYGMGLAMGLFNSVMNAGFFVAPLVAGLIMDRFGLSFIFLIAGLVGILGVCGFAFLCQPIIGIANECQ